MPPPGGIAVLVLQIGTGARRRLYAAAYDVGPDAVRWEVDPETLVGPGDDKRPVLAKRSEIGIGMDERLDVARREIAERGHGWAFVLELISASYHFLSRPWRIRAILLTRSAKPART